MCIELQGFVDSGEGMVCSTEGAFEIERESVLQCHVQFPVDKRPRQPQWFHPERDSDVCNNIERSRK